MKIILYICESQNWPVGPGGEISLLGVAAPLSSRKTGYLLRVAHMIPIYFSVEMAPDGPPRDSTHWLCLPRFSVKRMGTIIFFRTSDNQMVNGTDQMLSLINI